MTWQLGAILRIAQREKQKKRETIFLSRRADAGSKFERDSALDPASSYGTPESSAADCHVPT